MTFLPDFSMATWTLLVLLLTLLAYYAIWPYKLFKRYGIPGPTPIPFIGTFLGNRHDFGLSGPLKSSVLISKDEQWKRIRTVLSPTFTSGKLKQMFPLMNHYGELLVKNIHKKINNKEPLDMKQ
ncbi:hypothetical protein XENTR_v10016247 [Xenopus tropicalis]|nr:hypothetical protein XENTR_v10016247 [Xenopus tropicalis]